MRSLRLGRVARRDGQALAEFALVLPLLLLLIGGIIEFGRAWNIKQALTDASREGARYTVVQDTVVKSTTDVEAKVKERLTLANIDTSASKTNVTVVPSASWRKSGDEMTVTVTTKYRLGLVGALMEWTGGSSTVTIGSETTMRNE